MISKIIMCLAILFALIGEYKYNGAHPSNKIATFNPNLSPPIFLADNTVNNAAKKMNIIFMPYAPIPLPPVIVIAAVVIINAPQLFGNILK